MIYLDLQPNDEHADNAAEREFKRECHTPLRSVHLDPHGGLGPDWWPRNKPDCELDNPGQPSEWERDWDNLERAEK